ncbi:hypothetical protein JYU34_021326 [Plutella xylostella]|uniref:Uncharacterized protein n=1 Tax=Plutella xylostella TaxID=51655 RepID=A0ABQ7PTB5_PLUXY|nr:hypothetical protein JYU34_021326 [Plutella xylostella]
MSVFVRWPAGMRRRCVRAVLFAAAAAAAAAGQPYFTPLYQDVANFLSQQHSTNFIDL